jgi:hypothetical protein
VGGEILRTRPDRLQWLPGLYLAGRSAGTWR